MPGLGAPYRRIAIVSSGLELAGSLSRDVVYEILVGDKLDKLLADKCLYFRVGQRIQLLSPPVLPVRIALGTDGESGVAHHLADTGSWEMPNDILEMLSTEVSTIEEAHEVVGARGVSAIDQGAEEIESN